MKEFRSSKDPDLKVLLAVGGQDYAIRKANEMMTKNDSRQKFVISTTKLLRTHEFDGIDLNFEPSEALGPPSSPNPQLVEDKKKLTMLCKVNRKETLETNLFDSVVGEIIINESFLGTSRGICRRSWTNRTSTLVINNNCFRNKKTIRITF